MASTVARIARVVGRQEAHQRHQQERGVERVGVVVLGEHAALVDAVGADVGVDLVGRRLPARRRSSQSSRSARQPGAAVERDPAHQLRRGEVLAARRAPPRCRGRARASARAPPRPGCSRIGQTRSARWSRDLRVQVDRVEHRAPDVVLVLVVGAVADADRAGALVAATGGRASARSSSRSPSMPYMICSSSSPLGARRRRSRRSRWPPSRSRACTGPRARTSSRGSRCSGSPSCARRRASRAARWWPPRPARRSARRSGP